jgi:hypothetical protein
VPDLNDLDNFDQGLPVMDLLPAAEIRRRGDRLRRRRTALVAVGGVIAAAIAIGTPVVALSGPDTGHEISPAPRPSQTAPPNGWVTTIPDDFPLTSGFADPDATPNDGLAQDHNLSSVCLRGGFAGFTDNAVVTYQGESEDREVRILMRILIVYPDSAAAEADLAELRDAIDGCRPVPVTKGVDVVSDPVEADFGTEESFAFSQQIRHDGGPRADLRLFEVARTGNAIYVDMSRATTQINQAVGTELERLEENSTAPLGAMCTFAVDPCRD